MFEAARFWPNAKYVGLDVDPRQIERARTNARQLGASVPNVQLQPADVSMLRGIPVCFVVFQQNKSQNRSVLLPRKPLTLGGCSTHTKMVCCGSWRSAPEFT